MQASMTRRTGCQGALARTPSRLLSVRVQAAQVLIANTKGGGHAFVGLYLAKALLNKGHTVTILNDGDPAKLTKKAPYSLYSELAQQGAVVVWGDPAKPEQIPAGSFDVVYDNNGKSMETCKAMIDHFKGKVAHYVFVASAGAYKADPIEPQHLEGDARKASAGHVEVEQYLVKEDLPYTIFQPLYIYGPHTAKDCEQWFFDRVVRDRAVPIPGPGIQLTTLTHVEDVAAMLAAVPGNAAALRQQYNICSDRSITFQGIAKAAAKAAGKELKVVLYDPAKIGLGKGEGFPFRAGHFFASSEKAKRELGWKPKHDFLADVGARMDEYTASGRGSKDIDFSVDDKILAAVAAE